MAGGSERVGPKDECFSLKWNVHHAETFEAFESLRFKDALVDVSLCCEGHILKAHKLVLSACSPYFERILHDVGLRYPVLMFQDVPMYMMQLLLQFMYRGEVEIHSSILPNFIKLAESLDVKGLRKDREPSQGQRSNQQQSGRTSNAMNGDKSFNTPVKSENTKNCLEPCVQVSHDSSNMEAECGKVKDGNDECEEDVKPTFDDDEGAEDDGERSDDAPGMSPVLEDGCNEGEESELSLDVLRRDLKSTMIVPIGPDSGSAGPSSGRSPHWSSPSGNSSLRPSHSPAAAAAAAGSGGLGPEHPASIPLDISTEYEMYRVNGAIWRGYTHTRRVMYFCHFCDYKSPLKGNAVNHGRRHLGEKPFACPICGKAFTAVQNMKTHQMTHARDSLPPGMRMPGEAGGGFFGHSFVF